MLEWDVFLSAWYVGDETNLRLRWSTAFSSPFVSAMFEKIL